MTIHDAIIKALAISLEEERQKKTKTQAKPKPIAKTTVKKREIKWASIEANIKKYDSLTPNEQIRVYKNSAHAIPYWRIALKYHKQGFSDAETHKKTKEEQLKKG